MTQSGIKLAIVNLPGKAERENEEVLAISMDAPKEEEGGGEEERDRDSSDDNEEESIREDDTNEKEAIDVIDVQ